MFAKMSLQSIIVRIIVFDERRLQFYTKLCKRRTERDMQNFACMKVIQLRTIDIAKLANRLLKQRCRLCSKGAIVGKHTAQASGTR